jgi:hypothetical protein
MVSRDPTMDFSCPRAEVRRRRTVERKATFISQVTRGHIDTRETDNVGDSTWPHDAVSALARSNDVRLELRCERTTSPRLLLPHGLHRGHSRRGLAPDRGCPSDRLSPTHGRDEIRRGCLITPAAGCCAGPADRPVSSPQVVAHGAQRRLAPHAHPSRPVRGVLRAYRRSVRSSPSWDGVW